MKLRRDLLQQKVKQIYPTNLMDHLDATNNDVDHAVTNTFIYDRFTANPASVLWLGVAQVAGTRADGCWAPSPALRRASTSGIAVTAASETPPRLSCAKDARTAQVLASSHTVATVNDFPLAENLRVMPAEGVLRPATEIFSNLAKKFIKISFSVSCSATEPQGHQPAGYDQATSSPTFNSPCSGFPATEHSHNHTTPSWTAGCGALTHNAADIKGQTDLAKKHSQRSPHAPLVMAAHLQPLSANGVAPRGTANAVGQPGIAVPWQGGAHQPVPPPPRYAQKP